MRDGELSGETELEIRQLRYFVEIMDAGSLRQAADRLHIASTALGRQVKLLEEEFGTPLFNRNSRGISPTLAGEQLRAHAEELLSSVDDIHRRMVQGDAVVNGRGTIGMSTGIAPQFFGAVGERIADEHPGVGIAFVEGNAYTLWAGLETDDIDVALIVEPERQDNFEYEFVLADKLFLLSSAHDEDAPRDTITVAELAQYPIATSPRPRGIRRILDHAMARVNAVPNIAYEIRNIQTVVEFAARGLAHGIVSSSTLVTIDDKTRLAIAEIQGVSFDRTLVWRKKSQNRTIADILRVIMREEFLKLHGLPVD